MATSSNFHGRVWPYDPRMDDTDDHVAYGAPPSFSPEATPAVHRFNPPIDTRHGQFEIAMTRAGAQHPFWRYVVPHGRAIVALSVTETSSSPLNREEWEARIAKNQRFSGRGVEGTMMHMACPFCGAADFVVAAIMEVTQAMKAGATCSECWRAARMVDGLRGWTLVQTAGDDPPPYVPIQRWTPDKDEEPHLDPERR